MQAILFATVFLLMTSTSMSDVQYKIIDGQDADFSVYQYIVMLISTYTLSNTTVVRGKGCIGSLITPSWVLTAGHRGAKWIRYGNTSAPFDDQSMFIKILKSIPSPIYNAYTQLRYELQLLKLETEARVESYGRISAVDFNSLVGKRALILGYGMVYKVETTKSVMDRLYANVSVPLQSGKGIISKCPAENGPRICIAASCDSQSNTLSFGDSGSPVLVDGMIVGVCNQRSKFDVIVYTAISPFINWIYTTIQEK